MPAKTRLIFSFENFSPYSNPDSATSFILTEKKAASKQSRSLRLLIGPWRDGRQRMQQRTHAHQNEERERGEGKGEGNIRGSYFWSGWDGRPADGASNLFLREMEYIS